MRLNTLVHHCQYHVCLITTHLILGILNSIDGIKERPKVLQIAHMQVPDSTFTLNM